MKAVKEMRILLINVCLRYDSKIKQIPVGLAAIATALDRVGYRPDILDIDLHRYTEDEVDGVLKKSDRYDIVGFGNIVSGYKYTKKLAIQVKKRIPDALVVVGNTVATSVPRLLLERVPQIDIAVIGEGDVTIVEIARAVESRGSWNKVPGIAYRDGKKVIFTEKRQAIDDISSIPFPDYSLLDVEEYLSVSNVGVPETNLPDVSFDKLRALPVNTARGCPFSCTFCYHAFKEYKYRYYSFDRVVDHIKYLQDRYRINFVHFWDELTFYSSDRLRELCDEIEKAGIRFYWGINPRANTFQRKDLDLLKRARSLGALSIGGAFESADDSILEAMNKKISIGQYIEQVAVAREAGLKLGTSLVFGYPQETVDTIKKTIDLCRQLGLYPSVGFILPLPGSGIYEYARNKGFIKDEEEYLLRIGDRQDLHVNLTQMPDEVLVGTLKNELVKLKNDLNIQLEDDKVIKTGVYKIARDKTETVK